MIFQKDGVELELKLTATFKSRVKKLFAVAYQLKKSIATVQDIKKKFPRHNLTKTVSWFDICGTCLELIEAKEIEAEKNKPVFGTDEEILLNEITKYGCRATGKNTVGGISFKVGYNGDFLGNLGYCSITKKFYYCSGRTGTNKYVATVSEAMKTLVYVRGYSNLLETVKAA